MYPLLEFLGGVICAVVGGELFLRGVLGVSGWLRIPKAVTAATLAAFATSSPEISVAVNSAIAGEPQIALGDALGSNVVNIGLVLGLLIIMGPISFVWALYKREFVTALAAPIILCMMLADGDFSRSDAVMCLAVFFVWFLWVLRDALQARDGIEATSTARQALMAAVFGVIGLLTLVMAGKLIVAGGTTLGEMLGVSPFLIGVTIVAFGTSSPELATAVVSKLRGHDEVGIGTVLGSNVFNCLFIIGLAGAIHPYSQSVATVLPSVIFGILTVLALLPIQSSILGTTRGLLLLALYVGYIVAAWWFGTTP
jgi:cation:H+ antiporter